MNLASRETAPTIDPGDLCYLATPYSRYPGGLQTAFAEAASLVARLMAVPVHCYSPIVHSHPVATYGALDPLDHGLWMAVDEMMMRRCNLLLVAEMSGWQQSVGIGLEIAWFTRAAKPVVYLDPETLRMRATPLARALPPEGGAP